MLRAWLCCGLCALLLYAASPVFAEGALSVEESVEPSAGSAVSTLASASSTSAPPVSEDDAQAAFEPGALPFLFAWIPGVLLHGSGVYAAGDEDAGWRLLALEGAGLGAAIAGALSLWATRASRRTVGPIVAVTVSGFGLFVSTWLADLVGSAGLGESGVVPRQRYLAELRTGYQYVYDPLFEHHSFWGLEGALRLSAWHLSARVLAALHLDEQLYALHTGWRFFGPLGKQASADGSYLDFDLGVTHHRNGVDGFSVLGIEGALQGRLDFGLLGRSLRATFMELGLGWGLQFYAYPELDLALGTDSVDTLLARFRFGTVLGEWRQGQLELGFYYDHRRDTLAGGVGLNDISSGSMGFFGLDAALVLPSDEDGDSWTVHTKVEIGSALIAAVGLGYAWSAREAAP